MRQLTLQTLRAMGFKSLEEAKDGAQALKMLKASSYDLLITDWYMPNLSGLELIQAIRKDDELKALKVIMLSSEGEVEKVKQVAKLGIDSYITKPFSPATLSKKVTFVFQKTGDEDK